MHKTEFCSADRHKTKFCSWNECIRLNSAALILVISPCYTGLPTHANSTWINIHTNQNETLQQKQYSLLTMQRTWHPLQTAISIFLLSVICHTTSYTPKTGGVVVQTQTISLWLYTPANIPSNTSQSKYMKDPWYYHAQWRYSIWHTSKIASQRRGEL